MKNKKHKKPIIKRIISVKLSWSFTIFCLLILSIYLQLSVIVNYEKIRVRQKPVAVTKAKPKPIFLGQYKEIRPIPKKFMNYILEIYNRKVYPRAEAGLKNFTQYEELVRMAAQDYGHDFYLIAGLGLTESHYNPRAISDKGAIGLFQILLKYKKLKPNDPFCQVQTKAKKLLAKRKIKYKERLFDPAYNIYYGVGIFDYYYRLEHNLWEWNKKDWTKKFLGTTESGNLLYALVSYNSGPGTLNQLLNPPVIRRGYHVIEGLSTKKSKAYAKEFPALVIASAIAVKLYKHYGKIYPYNEKNQDLFKLDQITSFFPEFEKNISETKIEIAQVD